MRVSAENVDDVSILIPRLILNYVHIDPTVPLEPFIQPTNNKSLRGFNHPSTARLLTPIQWEANDVTYAEIKAGRREVSAGQLPRFLFPDAHVLVKDNLADSIFKGHVMIRCAKHLFVGPSAALQAPGFKKGRPGNAQIIGMSRMTPRALAYVAVQARFALSSAQEWHPVDVAFDYSIFFWKLVKMLEDDDGKEVLDFYDEELWGLTSSHHAAANTVPEDPDDIPLADQIEAQRATKRARTV